MGGKGDRNSEQRGLVARDKVDEVLLRTETPHPSACGCHLLPQEKAFLCAESKEKPRARRGKRLFAISAIFSYFYKPNTFANGYSER